MKWLQFMYTVFCTQKKLARLSHRQSKTPHFNIPLPQLIHTLSHLMIIWGSSTVVECVCVGICRVGGATTLQVFSDKFIFVKRRRSSLKFGGLLIRMRNFECRKLWTAPEILRSEDPPVGGTQKATDGSYPKIYIFFR